MGYSVRDITYLAMVQLRCDYAGDANAFARSTLCVQRSDHEATLGRVSPIMNAERVDEDVLELVLEAGYNYIEEQSDRER